MVCRCKQGGAVTLCRAERGAVTHHRLHQSPRPAQAILAIAQQCYAGTAQGFLLAVRGYEFEFIEELTPKAAENLRAALAMLSGWLKSVHDGASP